jgi:hypothetical protein
LFVFTRLLCDEDHLLSLFEVDLQT